MHYIYQITNSVNNKKYIGQTVNFNQRFKFHFWSMRNNRHFNRKIQNDVNEFGIEKFSIKCILIVGTKEESNYYEKEIVKLYDSVNNGYNVYEGGRFEYKRTPVRNGIKTVWNGVEYRSMREAARILGIDKESLRFRLEKGYSKDSDFNRRNSTRKVIWNNVEYEKLILAAKANNITPSSMHRRLSKGYLCDSDMIGSGNKP